MHSCLRTNFAQLSDACRKEELKLMIMESSNTELMPNLARACKVCASCCCCCEVHHLLATFPAPPAALYGCVGSTYLDNCTS